MILLELRNVTKEYPVRTRRPWFRSHPTLQAVKQVNLALKKGESLGLVGESGSGKSTLAKLIMNLEPVTSGEILLDGQALTKRRLKERQIYKRMQLVLQDSSASLYPNMRVGELLEEPIRNFFPEAANWEARCRELLDLVELDHSFLTRYPDQLSGGQKQRVCMAKALAVHPELIIFDESIASLDQPAQASITRMLKRIQETEQIAYLFITHDLQSALQLCDRITVMYQGELVETFIQGEVHQLRHPYSQLLFQTLDLVSSAGEQEDARQPQPVHIDVAGVR
ncbi:dipeptide/oligopeptide/nickel ABC transporter ATP-binding protein [Brevibacillus humidisoli]|uniref:ABC transporter ATP-binding protein n=1 Tax=Brevibacillus humidisoli TaxID=2895522 RepID=UPI001E5FE0BC|nr:dipeptide/oligopeptide/nickel ABC transporter ATP-binding protein [Brevibacillus humidisoli]UFJ39296.1 dipeptide/oligopeptide/nickel ABC transporter ATP-binding protein [Brevibacillus humidisoli]